MVERWKRLWEITLAVTGLLSLAMTGFGILYVALRQGHRLTPVALAWPGGAYGFAASAGIALVVLPALGMWAADRHPGVLGRVLRVPAVVGGVAAFPVLVSLLWPRNEKALGNCGDSLYCGLRPFVAHVWTLPIIGGVSAVAAGWVVYRVGRVVRRRRARGRKPTTRRTLSGKRIPL
ncbi:hypothetical protein [Streptomyces alkaliphilus]|uniref:hypothetical protein n=1 Tax=Streptomyces alkaliphilus TaxID=1472722 RepID=UPI00118084F4|nr:hypothetical protein [Streptomyces alkaliphilus]MQS08731.1 hypothetical protein [Streptomyces alkaliphilus]